MKLKTMISRADLLSSMEESNRPITSRRLTDWPKKHLVEKPRSLGRGHGKGMRYFIDPDILERSQFVHDALAHVTSKDALLMLAWAGFSVPAKLVRRRWIYRLTSFQKTKKQRTEERGYADDPYWELAALWSPRLSDYQGLRRDDLELVIATILKILYAPSDFRPEGDLQAELIVIANAWLRTQAPTPEAAKTIDIGENAIRRVTLLCRKAFSVVDNQELLKGTDISQFEGALSCLELTVRLAMAVFTTSENVVERLTVRAVFRAIVGPTLLTLFLRLISDGHVKRVEKTKSLCEQSIQKINSLPLESKILAGNKPGAELQEIASALFDGISDIWRGYNLFKLYNISQFPPISHGRKIISVPGKSNK